jgi:hypothetical protein
VDTPTKADATTKADTTTKVWAKMVTTVESTAVTTEVKETIEENLGTESTVTTGPTEVSFNLSDTEICTTSTTTTTTKRTPDENTITITSTTAKMTTLTTMTALPKGDDVKVQYITNSPTTEKALSETILEDKKVNGDENKSITVTTKTTTCYTVPEDTSNSSDTASTATEAHMRPTLAPRHFLRLFLRDRARAWRNPEIYHERIENGFAVPAARQFLPEVDHDPADATSTTGNDAHG